LEGGSLGEERERERKREKERKREREREQERACFNLETHKFHEFFITKDTFSVKVSETFITGSGCAQDASQNVLRPPLPGKLPHPHTHTWLWSPQKKGK
jgi:hypothetical protein